MEAVKESKETKAPVEPPQPVLTSQLKAFEGEILNLRADNQLLEQDKQELTDAIDKLTQGVRASDDAAVSMKAENQTLKLELKGHLTENIAIQKKLEGLLATVSTLKQRLEETKASEQTAVVGLKKLSAETDGIKVSAAKSMKTLQDKHAL